MLLGALKHEFGPLRSDIFVILYFFLVCDFAPLPKKNSGPNPMSFQFLVGLPWGSHEDGLSIRKSWLGHCEYILPGPGGGGGGERGC